MTSVTARKGRRRVVGSGTSGQPAKLCQEVTRHSAGAPAAAPPLSTSAARPSPATADADESVPDHDGDDGRDPDVHTVSSTRGPAAEDTTENAIDTGDPTRNPGIGTLGDNNAGAAPRRATDAYPWALTSTR